MNAPDELLARYFSGETDDAAVAELSDWIRSHPDHARHFAFEAVVHAKVREHFSHQATHRTASSVLRQKRYWATAAAIIVVATAVALMRLEIRGTLAEISGQVDAVWTVHDSGLRGVQTLKSGSVRIKYRSGANVIVQAPASFSVDSDRLDVHDGRVVVTCPTLNSRALVVLAGDGKIVDLGTQYGVDVASNGAVRLQVFEGAVELQRGSQTAVFLAGQTHDFGHSPTAKSNEPWLKPARFELSQQMATGGSGERWAKYLNELLADPKLVFASHTDSENVQIADLASATSLDKVRPPTFASDRFGRNSALTVDAESAAAAGRFYRSFDAITLSAWVKLDGSQAMPDWHRGLLMADGWNQPGQIHWQCKNDSLRISFFGRGDDLDIRFAARPQGLVDGQWHLLTTTVQRLPTTRVTHYLDGMSVFDRMIDAPVPPMRLNAFLIGGWRDGVSSEVQRPLYGAIDSVLVFARVLSADQVKQLYESSRP